ncbi:hypothetical protein [Methanobacterium oryzae]|uniref:hypothetical protein n=1 Tax=Methanobacterium oryzae TaxID=69540 RepID=UPI003D24048A
MSKKKYNKSNDGGVFLFLLIMVLIGGCLAYFTDGFLFLAGMVIAALGLGGIYSKK